MREEIKMCPFLKTAGKPPGNCMKSRCQMWRETKRVVQAQFYLQNGQIAPEVVREDRYCGLAGCPQGWGE